MEQVRVVIFADILGFKSLLKSSSLVEVVNIVKNLADGCNREVTSKKLNKNVSDTVSFELGHAQFSDAVLLWSPNLLEYSPEQRSRIRKLMTICASNFLGESVEKKIPIRLGMAEGPVVIDPGNNIYVGQPIVDAYELESAQQWIGGAIHSSVSKADVLSGSHKNAVEYPVPLKNKTCMGIAINWFYYTNVCEHTHAEIENWLKEMSGSVLSVPHGKECNDDSKGGIKEKYENTEEFLKWATKNGNPQTN